MHTVLASIGQACAGHHGKNARFAADGGVDLLGEGQQVLGGVVDATSSELHFEGSPSSVVAHDNRVDLESLVVPVVENPASERLTQHSKVPDDGAAYPVPQSYSI